MNKIYNINDELFDDSLGELFDNFIKIGYEVRLNKKNGLLEWQKYKNDTQMIKIKDYDNGITLNEKFIFLANSLLYTVNKNDNNHTNVILKLEKTILSNCIETHHFLIQHFRIPIMCQYRLPVNKILQIAYNIGQLKAVFENENIFSENVKCFYQKHQLDKFVTYVDLQI